ncbi:MAG: hypothetical protein ACKO96_45360, partial [Flammeovirgaceae bacterium]
IRATECGNADAVIDGNDDGCGIFAGPSTLQFSGTAGTTYYIGIGGYSTTKNRVFSLPPVAEIS